MPTLTYTPIQTQTLASNQATVNLNSIPSSYTDLILIVNAKWTGINGNCFVRFKIRLQIILGLDYQLMVQLMLRQPEILNHH